ncbi:hypothetical protein DHEL01_v206716, partial [Diaporthe helianthi]
RSAYAKTVTRHCECQSPISKLENLSSSNIDALLSGTMKWPIDNSTTASCCNEINPAGKINGPGDQFENACSVQKDVMGGTNNAAYQFLTCCYFRKGMLSDCYE